MKKFILSAFFVFTAMPSFAFDGFVGELLLGHSDQKLNASAKSVSNSDSGVTKSGLVMDGSATSYGIQGGYQFNNYFAVELGYQQYGEFTSLVNNFVRVTIDTSSINFGVKGILPLSENYSLNARMGVANWDLNNTSSVYAPGSDIDNIKGNGSDIYYGIGAQYKFNGNYFVGLNYSVLTMRWDTREDFPSGVFLVDYEHKVKNIYFSVGVFF